MAICDICNGKGYHLKTDFMQAKQVRERCGRCKGTGNIQEEQRDGIRVGKIAGVPYTFQFLVRGHVVSSIIAMVRPVYNEKGEPQFKVVSEALKVKQPRLCLEVYNMQTKRKYRKQGIMTLLFRQMLADPKIEYAMSSWDDSTADGRNFLLGRGWKQDGHDIIWRRPIERVSDAGDNSGGAVQPTGSDVGPESNKGHDGVVSPGKSEGNSDDRGDDADSTFLRQD